MSKKIRGYIGAYIETSGCTNAIELFQYIDKIAIVVIRRHFDNLDRHDMYEEDLRNDIIIKVIDNIEKLDKSKTLYSYIYTVAKNYITDRIRRSEVNTRRWSKYCNYVNRVSDKVAVIKLETIS